MRRIQIWQCVVVHVSFGVVVSLLEGFVDHFLRSDFVPVVAAVVAFVVAPVVCLTVDFFAFVAASYRMINLHYLLVTTMAKLARLLLGQQNNGIVMPKVDCLWKLPQVQRQKI